MVLKIEIEADTVTRNMNVRTNPQIEPAAVATLLSQAVTQALMMDQQQRALLINPLGLKTG